MNTFNEKRKKEIIAIAQDHQDQDRFIQGKWLREEKAGMFKGCFFGCMTQKGDGVLETASKEFEIPLWLVHVSEKIFEGLPSDNTLTFPVELLKSIPCNNDLDLVWRNWNKSVLTDQLRFTEKDSDQYNAIIQCIALFDMEVITESAAQSAAQSTQSTAWSAAWSAAQSAHYVWLKDELIKILSQSK